MHYFWIDAKRNLKVSYYDFFQDLIKEGVNCLYVKAEDPYILFLNLIRNFLNNKNSIILDSDFSELELNKLDITSDDIQKENYFQPSLVKKYEDFKHILDFLDKNKHQLFIQIFTSGTTGNPKKVSQTLFNITRSVKIDSVYQDNIWAFAYNPSHFAGLQVFFQALYNENKIVYVFNQDFEFNYKALVDNNSSHLSCTPTFLKMLLQYISIPNKNIRSITLGGEKFDERIVKSIDKFFPNAVVKNVYASTEAGSLLRAKDGYFEIPARYQKLIKIVDNELLIKDELLGDGENFEISDGWYHTGDIIEFNDSLENQFKFISRKTEIINVGGYKVNPVEIENLIKEVKGVKDVIVFGRKNSLMGNVIEADILKDPTISEVDVKNEIKSAIKVLQDFKHPRIIKFVDKFELTRSGKLKRS